LGVKFRESVGVLVARGIGGTHNDSDHGWQIQSRSTSAQTARWSRLTETTMRGLPSSARMTTPLDAGQGTTGDADSLAYAKEGPRLNSDLGGDQGADGLNLRLGDGDRSVSVAQDLGDTWGIQDAEAARQLEARKQVA